MALLNKLTQQGSVYTGLNGTTPPKFRDNAPEGASF